MTANSLKSSRLKFLLLVAIAFGPMLAAGLLFFHFPEYLPRATTNHGELIQPSIDGGQIAPALQGRGAWTLIHVMPDACDEECRNLLYLSRQVATGLGKDAARVSRVLIVSESLSADLQSHLALEHGDIEVVFADTARLKAVSSSLKAVSTPLKAVSTPLKAVSPSQSAPQLFLMDPNGNIMMRYNISLAGKPLLEDLKHLLKLSTIG